MDRKFIRKLLIGMMVLVILIFIEVQTDDHHDIFPHPHLIYVVQINKREKLPLLLHTCLLHKREQCTYKSKNYKEFFQCIVQSYEICINKPMYLNELVYHIVKSFLDECNKEKQNPFT